MANNKYVIFTDSCSDLSTAERKQLNVEYLRMGLVVDGVEMEADLDWEAYKPEEFYGWLEQGKKIKTNQVSLPEFEKRFTPYLEQGYDILYLGCAGALSGSVGFCNQIAASALLEKFPDRKIVGIDTCCGSYTEGMCVVYACKKRDEGLSFDELIAWVEENKNTFNQFATVDTLKYLKEAGRIKGTAAFFGDIIGVKPIFISDAKGNNFVIQKVRGTKASIDALVEGIKTTIIPEECDYIQICQGMAHEKAEIIKGKFEELFPNIPVKLGWIGPIVGTTCGPGIIGVFCHGKQVTRFDGDGIPTK